MVDFVKVFKTIEGDVYHITLSQETSILSFKTLDAIKDTTLVGIDLRRLEGRHATGQAVLAAIEKTIADYYLQKKDVVICYYCDFINPIPRTTKNTLPPQEYRSRLFKRMFQRYVRQNSINDVHLSIVEVSGINESYYFHIIYRDGQANVATMIADDLREGYGK